MNNSVYTVILVSGLLTITGCSFFKGEKQAPTLPQEPVTIETVIVEEAQPEAAQNLPTTPEFPMQPAAELEEK